MYQQTNYAYYIIEYVLPESDAMPNFDITLGIDTSKLPKS